MCVAEGFPAVPFFVDTDLSRADGIVRCRKLTSADTLRLAWKELRLLKYLRYLPIEF